MRNTSTITLLLFVTILCSPLLINADPVKKSGDSLPSINVAPTYNCNPNFDNKPQFTNAPQFTSSPQFINSPQFTNYIYSFTYTLYMQIKNTTTIWIEDIKKKATRENYELIKELIKTMLWEHRYKIAGGTVVGSYSATSVLLLADYHYLSRSTAWSRWKPECTFEDLCAIPQKDLARELLLTIGQCYYNDKNPTDLAHPLIQFLTTIDTEIKTIKRYIGTTKIIKRLHLITIFPTNETKIAQAQKLLERALFIKHIFLSWLSDYNLASNYKN